MNQYGDKLDEFLLNMKNLMFTFEITKCCGYSVLVSLYKTHTVLDLYSHIIEHFGENIEIKELFFYSPEGERIKLHLSKKPLTSFIRPHIICNPAKLVPVYPLPNPVVYRLYIDDGHCTNNCDTNHCTGACQTNISVLNSS